MATGSGEVEVVGRHQALRRDHRGQGSQPDHPARLLLLPAGAQRLRQDHDPAHDRRPREAHRAATSGSAARSVVGLPPVERGTAMMFQSYALFPHRSVLDNVAFALKMRGVGTAERHAKARELLAKVQLEKFADRLPAAALGRPAAARGAGARADHQSARAAARRAAVGARRIPAPAHARRAAPRAEGARHHLHPRHAHPARGDRRGRHGRGDGAGPHRAGRPARATSSCAPRNAYVARFIGGQNVLSRRGRERDERHGRGRRRERRALRLPGRRRPAAARLARCAARSAATASPSRRWRPAPSRPAV